MLIDGCRPEADPHQNVVIWLIHTISGHTNDFLVTYSRTAIPSFVF